MRKMVGNGNKAAPLGKALATSCHRGAHHLELAVDVASSPVALNLWGMVERLTKGLVVDLGFVLDSGRQQRFLPERLLASVRIHRVDLARCGALEAVEEEKGRGGET